MDDQQRQEYIEAYLNEELSPEDARLFEERLQADAIFAEEFQLHQHLHMEFSDSKLNDFRALLREEAAIKPATKVIPFNIRRVLSLAASVAVLITAGIFYFSNRTISPENLYTRYMEQPDLIFDGGVARGQESVGLDTITALMKQADNFYNQQNFASAIDVLESAEPSRYRGYEDLVHLRLGIYHLSNGQTETALTYFDQITEVTESVRWYKSLGLLKLSRTAEIPALLGPLTTYDNPKQEAAQFILKKIR